MLMPTEAEELRGDILDFQIEIERMRNALSGPIRDIAYDVAQGGVLGEMLLVEIERALDED